MKKLAGLTCALAMAVSLGACSSGGSTNSTADYCHLLKSTKAQVSQMDLATLTEAKYKTLLGKLNSLAAAAPSPTLQKDWKTVSGRLTSFHQILAQAGLSLNDLPKLSNGQVPAGVDPTKLQAAAKKLEKLNADNSMAKAKTDIDAHAKKACHINLG